MKWIFSLVAFATLLAAAPFTQAQSGCQNGAFGLPYTTTQDLAGRTYKHLCVTQGGQITYTVNSDTSGGLRQQPYNAINMATSGVNPMGPFSASGLVDVAIDLTGVGWVSNGTDPGGSALRVSTMPGALLRSFDGNNTGCIFQFSNSTCMWFDPLNNFFEYGASLGDTSGFTFDMTNHVITETSQAIPWDLGSSLRPFGNVYSNAFHLLGVCSSAASPAVCGSSAAGIVAVPAGTNPTLTVNTTSAQNAALITIQIDQTKGAALAVTCNTTLPSGAPVISAKVNGTSFTVQVPGTFTTNPVCLTFQISKQ